MPSAPYWKLRRLAPRAKRVQRRRGAESAALGPYGDTLPGKADAFMAAYDTAAKYESTWKKERAEGRGELSALLKKMRSWLPLLVRDVPGFDGGDFGDKPDVPDDMIADGERLEEMVEKFADAEGQPLAYKDKLLGDVAVEAATKEWTEAEAADSTYQKLLAEVRAAGAVLDVELQIYRRTLRAVVGSSDKDCQKLRVERAASADEDDDSNAPTPPAPVAPAPGGEDTPPAG